MPPQRGVIHTTRATLVTAFDSLQASVDADLVLHPQEGYVAWLDERINACSDFLENLNQNADLLSVGRYNAMRDSILRRIDGLNSAKLPLEVIVPQLPLYDDRCYNSLSHHGTNHDLNRYGIAVHGFIDGFTRFVTGIRAHDNNHPESVLGFFGELIEDHGLPRRVRGSYGGENILVAEYMEDARGSGRGSYLWSSSGHNIRNCVGRLWVDFKAGVGTKWKQFFEDLEELEDGANLNPNLPDHIWLLHFLFLDALNQDITEWVDMWNCHPLSIPREGSHSPDARRFFNIAENGGNPLVPRNFEPVGDPIDIDGPGTQEGDWEDDWPKTLRTVEVDEPVCPFTEAEMVTFQGRFGHIPEAIRSSHDMAQRELLWIYTLLLYLEMKA